jgi:hypothetical protein
MLLEEFVAAAGEAADGALVAAAEDAADAGEAEALFLEDGGGDGTGLGGAGLPAAAGEGGQFDAETAGEAIEEGCGGLGAGGLGDGDAGDGFVEPGDIEAAEALEGNRLVDGAEEEPNGGRAAGGEAVDGPAGEGDAMVAGDALDEGAAGIGVEWFDAGDDTLGKA